MIKKARKLKVRRQKDEAKPASFCLSFIIHNLEFSAERSEAAFHSEPAALADRLNLSACVQSFSFCPF